jgi:hypothetical protein
MATLATPEPSAKTTAAVKTGGRRPAPRRKSKRRTANPKARSANTISNVRK